MVQSESLLYIVIEEMIYTVPVYRASPASYRHIPYY